MAFPCQLILCCLLHSSLLLQVLGGWGGGRPCYGSSTAGVQLLLYFGLPASHLGPLLPPGVKPGEGCIEQAVLDAWAGRQWPKGVMAVGAL